jgi:hypothetical protein
MKCEFCGRFGAKTTKCFDDGPQAINGLGTYRVCPQCEDSVNLNTLRNRQQDKEIKAFLDAKREKIESGESQSGSVMGEEFLKLYPMSDRDETLER